VHFESFHRQNVRQRNYTVTHVFTIPLIEARLQHIVLHTLISSTADSFSKGVPHIENISQLTGFRGNGRAARQTNYDPDSEQTALTSGEF
jgi:hypothetical protein